MELGTGAQPVVRMRARSKVFNLPLRLAQLSLQPPPQPENQQKLPAVQKVREEHEGELLQFDVAAEILLEGLHGPMPDHFRERTVRSEPGRDESANQRKPD